MNHPVEFMESEGAMTDRWTPLKFHPIQAQLVNSNARFRVVPAGRRSGKTELAKRFTIREAIKCVHPNGRFIFSAPTRPQAKQIYWDDTKQLIPKWMKVRTLESELTVELVNGAKVIVMGMERPQRVEGPPLDGIVFDEYAAMRPGAWGKSVRAALDTLGRPGWAWFIGRPIGRNHYYRLYKRALADTTGQWLAVTWKSESILPPKYIREAKADLDLVTFRQEYEASFETFEGRAYYAFDIIKHCLPVKYNPNLPLIFCFDFNVSPGVCAILQEQTRQTSQLSNIPTYLVENFTACIGEVYIPKNSNTTIVCNKLINDWKHHTREVFCYGDATGGNPSTSGVAGSDWDLVRQYLRPAFGDRIHFYAKRSNPPERARVNAVNSRLLNANGEVKFVLHAKNAEHVVTDLDGVVTVEGGSGEIDKKHDLELTHLTDALGYYIEQKYPVETGIATFSSEVITL